MVVQNNYFILVTIVYQNWYRSFKKSLNVGNMENKNMESEYI